MSSLGTIKRVEGGADGNGVRVVTASGPDNGRSLEAVERARGAESVGSHFSPCDPVSNLKTLGQLDELSNAVDRVAGWSPDTGGLRVVVS